MEFIQRQEVLSVIQPGIQEKDQLVSFPYTKYTSAPGKATWGRVGGKEERMKEERERGRVERREREEGRERKRRGEKWRKKEGGERERQGERGREKKRERGGRIHLFPFHLPPSLPFLISFFSAYLLEVFLENN